uniref:I-set domain-containing protein n=1 Tax=Nippostrongylus brasiliensis TaxID=27835 RepID=A0A0N4XQN6_NIPBR
LSHVKVDCEVFHLRYSPAPPQTPVGPSAPIFLKELRHQPLKPSEVMVMEARVAGVPQPQVEWLKNGKPLQNYRHSEWDVELKLLIWISFQDFEMFEQLP